MQGDVDAVAATLKQALVPARQLAQHIFCLPRMPDTELHQPAHAQLLVPQPPWLPPGLARDVLLVAWYIVEALAGIVPAAEDRHQVLASLRVEDEQCVQALASDVQHLAWQANTGLAQPLLCNFTRLKALKLKGEPDVVHNRLECVPWQSQHLADAHPAALLEDALLIEALMRLRHLDLRNNLLGDTVPNSNALVGQLKRHTKSLTLLCLRGNPLLGDRLTFAPGDLPELQCLDVTTCKGRTITGQRAPGFGRHGVATLPQLGNLTNLHLAETVLTVPGGGQPAMSVLTQLQRLRHLDLSRARMADADREMVRRAGLPQAALQPTAHAQLWPALTSLKWQSDAALHDHIAIAILVVLHRGCLPSLRHLDLAGGKQAFLHAPGQPDIAAMTAQLTFLDVCGRRLGQQRAQLVLQSHAQQLRHIGVSEQDVTIAALHTLRDVPPEAVPRLFCFVTPKDISNAEQTWLHANHNILMAGAHNIGEAPVLSVSSISETLQCENYQSRAQVQRKLKRRQAAMQPHGPVAAGGGDGGGGPGGGGGGGGGGAGPGAGAGGGPDAGGGGGWGGNGAGDGPGGFDHGHAHSGPGLGNGSGGWGPSGHDLGPNPNLVLRGGGNGMGGVGASTSTQHSASQTSGAQGGIGATARPPALVFLPEHSQPNGVCHSSLSSV